MVIFLISDLQSFEFKCDKQFSSYLSTLLLFALERKKKNIKSAVDKTMHLSNLRSKLWVWIS